MTHASVSPLRQRLIDDMTIRHFASRTQHAYIRAIRRFSAFLGASPDQAGFEDVRRYQLFLTRPAPARPPSTTPSRPCASSSRSPCTDLRSCSRSRSCREPRKLPVVLSPDEVARLLEAAPNLKSKAALSVAYGAGLRASEVVTLKVSDIDSTRMVIRVEQGKGRKDRYVMLSPQLLALLRAWWKAARPQGWLFPGPEPGQPAHPAPAQPRLPCRRPPGRDRQARDACTPCATASPPTCSSRTSTSASSRCCSGIPSSTPPPATPASPPSSSAPS